MSLNAELMDLNPTWKITTLNYIYLSIYLDQIDTSDHNAIQKYIYDMVSKHNKHDCAHTYLESMIEFQITREKHNFHFFMPWN